MKNTFKTVLSIALVLAIMLGLAPQVLGYSANDKMVELEWMRSSEDSFYVMPVEQAGDAWNYSEAIVNTPLRYFQTTEAQQAALDRADAGKEWLCDGGFKVGADYIWDRGNFFDKYKVENGNAAYDWASWKHHGIDAMPNTHDGEYSVRRFSTYVDIPQEIFDGMTNVLLAPTDELGNMSYLFPINDTVFVFVNGKLAFWGGTDIVEGRNVWGAMLRTTFLGLPGVPVINGVNGALKNVYPHTDGWCIDLEKSKDRMDIKSLLNPGFNRIDVFADDFWEGGGMNKLNLFFDSEPEEEIYGTIVLEKFVDGVKLGKFDFKGVSPADLIAGFDLYRVSGIGGDKLEKISFVSISDVLRNGNILFSNLADGCYVVEEVLTPAGESYFKSPAPLYVTINNSKQINAADFDYDAKYTIVNGLNRPGYRTLNYPGLNNNAEIFYIGITNSKTGVEYISFCANGGSKNFAGDNHLDCTGYMTGKSTNDSRYLDAFNYIEDKYGDLNQNRAITQMVIWTLLGAVDVDSELFDATTLTDAEKAAVRDTVANYNSYKGSGSVTGVVYMLCENPDHTFEYCQPQIVPLYAGGRFDNRTNTTDKKGNVSFNKTMYGGVIPFSASYKFDFDLFKIEDGKEIKIGTYSTDAKGAVKAEELEPGSYVFKEAWTLFWNESPDNNETGAYSIYNLVWSAQYPGGGDGLYFEITKAGETRFADGKDKSPTVDNILYCKHHVLWGAGDDFYFSYDYDIEKCGDGNVIIFKNNCDKYFEVQDVVAPTCERRGIVWLGCPDGCTGTGVWFGEMLGHNFEPVEIAPGYGDGFVWFGCPNGCGGGYAEYDLDAWYALGGYDFE